ncbi:MAG: PEP-CTERM sorting domain-containing protein [Myxococcota bacterium]
MRRLTLALVVLLVALPVTAALVDNGTSMIDTGTNLEWLDLPETQGLSVNQVLASNFVTVDGYVHATDEQVLSLFINAGFATGPSVQDASNDAAAALLLSFLGCTQFCGVADLNGTGRGFADWNGLGTYTRAFYKEGPLGGSYATTSGLTADLDLTDATAGHFLVRLVPEPGTGLLLGLGLVALGMRRRP